jgi:hypothetical protein
MHSQRTHLKRAVAALMPLCLLWLFAACILICGLESAERHGQSIRLSTVEIVGIKNAPTCEGCPLASLPKATIQERATFKPDLRTIDGAAASILSVNTPVCVAAFVSPRRRTSFNASPPTLFLSALRI